MPRKLRNAENAEKYDWRIGNEKQHHMILVPTSIPNQFVLEFDPFILIRNLREGVFGPKGYYQELLLSEDLQTKYCECLKEMDSYKIRFS
ncbi:MAG: hypothetical protein IMZ53_10975 [Thermoplasmata archaeon]|nr:hypothetical protein [Thermoplasmata archaeon]